MAKLYTRTGDKGTTRLGDNRQVPKDDRRVTVSGVIDEASSALGLARAFSSGEIASAVLELQGELVKLMSRISLYDPNADIMPVSDIENRIEMIKAITPIQSVFVAPGESRAGAALHMARSILRRAEREAAALSREEEVGEDNARFINRASDYVYALAEWADFEETVTTVTNLVIGKIEKINGGKPEEGGVGRMKVSDISLDDAKVILSAMEKKATEGKVPMVMAVADNHGALIAFARQDGALQVSLKLAPAKAHTAVQLKMPTAKLAEAAQPGHVGNLYGIHNDSSLVIFGGGIPLIRDGEVAGGVGVSGGSVAEDVAVAEAALSAWESLKK